MQFYGIPMETQLNICVFPQNYRIEKPKLVEIIWLALLDLWGRQRQAMGPCPGETSPGTRHRGRASIFAWQCRRESEYLSLAGAAWCRMLKEAGLLHVGRETLYRHKKYLQIYKGLPHERGTKRPQWRKRFPTVRAIQRWYGLHWGNELPILTGVQVVIRYRLSYFQDDLNLNDSTCVF